MIIFGRPVRPLSRMEERWFIVGVLVAVLVVAQVARSSVWYAIGALFGIALAFVTVLFARNFFRTK